MRVFGHRPSYLREGSLLTEEMHRIALTEKYQVGNACIFPFSFGVYLGIATYNVFGKEFVTVTAKEVLSNS